MSHRFIEQAEALRASVLDDLDAKIYALNDAFIELAGLHGKHDAVADMIHKLGGAPAVYPDEKTQAYRSEFLKWCVQLSHLNAKYAEPKRTAEKEAEEPVDPTAQPDISPRTGPRPTDNASKEDVANLARELIEERGEPIQRPTLLSILTDERGMKIQGSNPLTVLSTMLWRTRDMARIVHLRGHGYWLTERDWPPAEYKGQSSEERTALAERNQLREEAADLRQYVDQGGGRDAEERYEAVQARLLALDSNLSD